MEELIIEAGTEEKIGEGLQRVKRLEIREDATLVFEDTTTLIVNKFIAHKNSKILYKASDFNQNPSFNLYCLDASAVEELEVIGHGKPGKSYAGSRASRGGNGGHGGDIGKAYVFVVLDDALFADRAKSNQLIESINIEFDTAAGDGGSGGSGGSGGQPGKGALIGPASKKSGPDGRDGRDGDLGDGPQSDATVETWASVDILAMSAYQQFVAQQLQKP